MLDGYKMEKLIINHQRRRTKRGNIPNGYHLHHKIPYCLSEDDSSNNLMLIKAKEHTKISGIDRKALNYMKKLGFIESVTHYSLQLNLPKEYLKKQFLLIRKYILDTLDRLDTKFKPLSHRETIQTYPSFLSSLSFPHKLNEIYKQW